MIPGFSILSEGNVAVLSLVQVWHNKASVEYVGVRKDIVATNYFNKPRFYRKVTGVIYAIELNTVDADGLRIVKVKIGKTTDLESRLANFQTGMFGEPEVLNVWRPNPDVSLSSAETGVLELAEKNAYDRGGEAFVFLQDGYQQFSETADKLLKTTTLREINGDGPEPPGEDHTGEVPAVIKLHSEAYAVSSWADCLVTVAEAMMSQVQNKKPLKQVRGQKVNYVVEEGEEAQMVSPKPIADSNLYIETNFSANDVVRVSEKILTAYDHDLAEFRIFTE